ncbi:hypothetical protein [Oerskovia paurometabola]|uniref:hypothetical protein n=1 Tax=Oerskovia paurometabola TaxID=162170 RepID=UPI0034197B1F
MAIDFTTALGQVRLLISDVSTDPAKVILSDGMIAGYLHRWGITDGGTKDYLRGPVGRAAADALDAIATSEALVSKVIRTGDGVSTDGAKVADALRKQAVALRAQADKDDIDEGPDEAGFDVIEFQPYPRAGWW